MKLTINVKTGNAEFVQVDDHITEVSIWHHDTPLRLVIPVEKDIEFRLSPTLSQLYNYLIADTAIPRVVENGFIYIYVSYIMEQHRELLETSEVVIETKP